MRYVKTVDPNGDADYSSIALWEDGEATQYTAGDIAEADCVCKGSLADLTAAQVKDWTPGVEARIIVNPAHVHEGKAANQRSDGNYIYRMVGTYRYAHRLTLNHSPLKVVGLLIDQAGNDFGCFNFQGMVSGASSANTIVEQCIGVRSKYATFFRLQRVTLRNCIAAASDSANGLFYVEHSQDVFVYNCTACNNQNDIGKGFEENTVYSTYFYNCVAMENPGGDFVSAGGGTNTLIHCVSSDGTAISAAQAGYGNVVNKTDYTDYFVDPDNNDFHLTAPSEQLWGISGEDYSDEFTTDIDGQTRVNWDIGADEYVAAGGNSYTLEAALGSFGLTGIAAGLLAARKLASDTGSFALGGQSATLKAARKIGADGGTFALSGLAAGLRTARKIGADVGAFSLAGQDLDLLYGRRIAADAGAFTLTGMDAALLHGRRLAADLGTFSLVGQDLDLLYGRKLSADAGAFTFAGEDATLIYTPAGAYVLTADGAVFALSGNAAGLLYGRKVSADSGVFSLTGQDAGLKAARRVSADSGAFQFNGQDATLVYTPVGSYILTADGGVYALTGNEAALRATRKISADSGVFAWSGQDASLLKGYRITADSAGYVLTGEAAELLRAYLLEAGYGVFAVTGADARLEWSGLLLPKIIRATITGRGPRATITGRGPHATIRGV